MRYNSLQEYFFKLYNPLYAFILIPLLVLVVLYWQLLEGNIHGPFYGDQAVNQVLMVSLGIIVLSDWVISFYLFAQGLKSTRKIVSLGTRLDRYYSLTLVRFALLFSGSVVLAIGYALTENQLFTLGSVSNLVLPLLLWPLPSKVCRDLMLKGDERTLVLYKKDRLH
jgi:hypothetical protein